MIQCVHPAILKKSLTYSFNKEILVKGRFNGIQVSTWHLSPEELDNSSDLKFSDGISLADDMMELYKYFVPKILGGCCGTDNTHIEEIAKRLKGRKV
jgi:S-methylmethionine-dependent homocysteine/selenocysteine methylase